MRYRLAIKVLLLPVNHFLEAAVHSVKKPFHFVSVVKPIVHLLSAVR